MTKSCRIIIVFFVLVTCARTSSTWPLVQATKESHTYNVHAGADSPLDMVWKSATGVPIYKFECHNGNYEDMSFINFSGDFQCVLVSLEEGRRSSWNLLASDDQTQQTSDFFNRARMTSNQIRGECGLIPEYGRVRHFRLRGLRVTFEFKDLRWTPSSDAKEVRLSSFTFVVDVKPDATATSSTAERVSAPWPGPPCR